MEKRNRMLFVGIFMIMFALLVSGATFAYFTAEITNPIGSSIIIKMDTLELIYQDTEAIEVIGAFPGWTGTKTIKVKNNGGSTISYDLLWNKLDNGFNNKQDLRYSITCSSNCTGLSDTYVPYGGTRLEIIGEQSIEPGEIQTYTVKFTFRETGANQNENQGMKMTGSMTIKQTGVDNNPTRTVAEVILDTYGGADKIASQSTPDFSKPSPYITGNMAMSNFNNGIMRTATTGSPIYSAVDYAGMYATTDQDGTTYYYRGAVDNNYVDFAGYTWRIMRINGDGTIRLILNNTIEYNGEGAFAYNADSSCKYGGTTTMEKAISCVKYSTSNVKTIVDSWFNENIVGNNLNYVTAGKFCNDYSYKEMVDSDGDTVQAFNSYYRYEPNLNPTLTCTTVDSSFTGTPETLTLNAGLITFDEVVLAGSNYKQRNERMYLYGSNSWTISPVESFLNEKWVSNFMMGTMAGSYINRTPYVRDTIRPVINLKANVLVTGDGTINNKYTITGLK